MRRKHPVSLHTPCLPQNAKLPKTRVNTFGVAGITSSTCPTSAGMTTSKGESCAFSCFVDSFWFFYSEANPSLGRRFRWCHKLPNGLKHDPELLVILLFKLFQLPCKVLVCCENLPQADKGPHDLNKVPNWYLMTFCPRMRRILLSMTSGTFLWKNDCSPRSARQSGRSARRCWTLLRLLASSGHSSIASSLISMPNCLYC